MSRARRLSLEAALGLLPEPWRQPLAHLGSLASLSNANDLLQSPGGERWVLRRQGAAVGTLGIDRAQERRLAHWAGEQGFGPALLYGHVGDGILLSEYIEPEAIAADSPEYIIALAQSLKQLHRWGRPGRVLPFACRQLDLGSHLDHYWAQLSPMLQTQLLQGVASWPELRGAVASWRGEAAFDRCLCHNDLNPGNILSSGGQLWLLDWEYAALGNPLVDLAGALLNHPWGEPQLALFLSHYDGQISPAAVYRAALPVAATGLFWHALHGSGPELVAEAKATLAHYWRGHP